MGSKNGKASGRKIRGRPRSRWLQEVEEDKGNDLKNERKING